MKEHLKEELKSLAPFLLDKKYKEGMQVPTDYFDQLSNEIFDKLDAQRVPESAPDKQASLWSRIPSFPKWAMAFASIALLAFWINSSIGMDSDLGIDLADISDQEIIEYASDYVDELGDQDIDELINDIDIYDLEELL